MGEGRWRETWRTSTMSPPRAAAISLRPPNRSARKSAGTWLPSSAPSPLKHLPAQNQTWTSGSYERWDWKTETPSTHPVNPHQSTTLKVCFMTLPSPHLLPLNTTHLSGHRSPHRHLLAAAKHPHMKPITGTRFLNSLILPSQLKTAALRLDWLDFASFLKPCLEATTQQPSSQTDATPIPTLPWAKSKLRKKTLQNNCCTGLHCKTARLQKNKSFSPWCCLRVQLQTNPGHQLLAAAQRVHQQHPSRPSRRKRLAAGQIWLSVCPSVLPAVSRPTAFPRDKRSSGRTQRAGGTSPGCPGKSHRPPDLSDVHNQGFMLA